MNSSGLGYQSTPQQIIDKILFSLLFSLEHTQFCRVFAAKTCWINLILVGNLIIDFDFKPAFWLPLVTRRNRIRIDSMPLCERFIRSFRLRSCVNITSRFDCWNASLSLYHFITLFVSQTLDKHFIKSFSVTNYNAWIIHRFIY